jgi:glycosyltransferase 2 family protein
MTPGTKKWMKRLLRWGVAAVGTWYVLVHLSWNSRVLAIFDASNVPHWATVLQGDENSPQLIVRRWGTGRKSTISMSQVISAPDRPNMTIQVEGKSLRLLGVDLADHFHARQLLVMTKQGAKWVAPSETNYQVSIPHPRVQVGVRQLLAAARQGYLLWALLIFPITYVITSFRWNELLKALDVRLPLRRAFALNMVGAFYSTFMPGSTGGDVLKAYYVAKQTHHRTRAVMSVFVDRVIGLLALVILGGTMAAFAAIHWHIHQTISVAFVSLAILAATAAGLTIFYNVRLRRLCGLDWLLGRLPRQDWVEKIIETMNLYGRRPGLVTVALIASLPVHMTMILAAWMAGTALHLHIPGHYYWTVVPVVVLTGSIPISPQGAGVMEYFAIWLLQPVGCTVAEALALTMSIRLIQVTWNLAGGLLVLRGGYHAPTAAQERALEAQEQDPSPPAVVQT